MADALLEQLADYVVAPCEAGPNARATARLCLLDALACALLATNDPACMRRIGPVVPEAIMPYGVRVPGTPLRLDPVQAAFCTGTLIRWLDFNDTWLAAEWGHPSDNLGAILAAADYRSRREDVRIRTVIDALIKAYEIQGVLALDHAFNRRGLDHVILVRVASAAVSTWLLGGDREAIVSALSHAFLDGGALRTYRQAPGAGPRKSWAAGDATARGLRLALMALSGEPACPCALSAPRWGFHDVFLDGRPMTLRRPLGSYVVENILFKLYPAEFHAQTAVEAAIRLHPHVKDRLDAIAAVEIATQEPALRIIDKSGPLTCPADRDHCLQYMVAVALLKGDLTTADYEDAAAADPRIDPLRSLMRVHEDPTFTAEYDDPAVRSVGNAVRVLLRDGSASATITVTFPLGHPARRGEGLPLLRAKIARGLGTRVDADRGAGILGFASDESRRLASLVDLVST